MMEPLVPLFVDLTGSTRAMQKRGAWRVEAGIVKRLSEMDTAFKTADPTAKRMSTEGDGFFLIGTDPVALLVAALLEQGRWAALQEGLPARIAIGHGLIGWSGKRWDSDAYGEVINLTKRVLDACPSGAVALTDSAKESVQERPEVRDRLRRETAFFKGIGTRPYWVVNTGGEEMISMLEKLTRSGWALKTLVTILIAITMASSGWAFTVSWGAAQAAVSRLNVQDIENVKRDVRLNALEEGLKSVGTDMKRVNENLELLIRLQQRRSTP